VSAPPSAVEDRAFWLLVLAASAAFAWILWPFFGAVLWGTVIAILFAPLQRRLVRIMRGRRSLAALVSLAIIVLLVILPLALVATLVLQEAVNLYQAVQAGEIAPGRYLQQILDALPSWLQPWLARVGLTDLGAIQERISASFVKALQFVGPRALSIGQNTFDFVVDTFIMLYLLFFLLRDGDGLTARIREALPLQPALKRDLGTKFTTVIRATIKGGIVVAIVQGALGGLIFWLLGIHAPVLWGVLMAFLSLLPAVGAGLVWAPVAIWLLLTGAVLKGVVLIAFGVLVIGLVDNVLRPILVGKETRLPDWLVLIATLGGLAVFGLNGFVVGPVIAAIFIASWDIFSDARREEEAPETREVPEAPTR
jgi:predicted PurR-regulated permease PerM